jgi:CRP/FNR family cyclic AMP-dependent transcriptional regulator
MLEREGTHEPMATTTADGGRPSAMVCPTCGAITRSGDGIALPSERGLRGERLAAVLRAGEVGNTKPSPSVADNAGALILQEDHELAEQLPKRQREDATQLLRAPVIEVGRGNWIPPQLDPGASFGLMLLDGLVARRVEVAGASAMEILGPGDIVRPSEDAGLDGGAPLRADWEVFQPARLAVLDQQLTSLIARWPELLLAFSDRLVRRTGRLSYLLALSHLRRIEDRLLGMLWYLAASWGRVTPHGLKIPISLTHQALGELAGAKRSSVTLALATLRDRGLVSRMPDGTYVLDGDRLPWQQPPFDRLAPKSGMRANRHGR